MPFRACAPDKENGMNVIRASIQCIAAVCLLVSLLECAAGDSALDDSVKAVMGLAVASSVVRALANAISLL